MRRNHDRSRPGTDRLHSADDYGNSGLVTDFGMDQKSTDVAVMMLMLRDN